MITHFFFGFKCMNIIHYSFHLKLSQTLPLMVCNPSTSRSLIYSKLRSCLMRLHLNRYLFERWYVSVDFKVIVSTLTYKHNMTKYLNTITHFFFYLNAPTRCSQVQRPPTRCSRVRPPYHRSTFADSPFKVCNPSTSALIPSSVNNASTLFVSCLTSNT